jgi:hypothetical protein
VDVVADVEPFVKPGANVLTIRRPHAPGSLTTAPVLVLDVRQASGERAVGP